MQKTAPIGVTCVMSQLGQGVILLLLLDKVKICVFLYFTNFDVCIGFELEPHIADFTCISRQFFKSVMPIKVIHRQIVDRGRIC